MSLKIFPLPIEHRLSIAEYQKIIRNTFTLKRTFTQINSLLDAINIRFLEKIQIKQYAI